MYLIFDTETTGLPRSWSAPITDTDNWPRCIQIAWQLHDEMGNLIEHQDYLVKPEGFNIRLKGCKYTKKVDFFMRWFINGIDCVWRNFAP